jgi:hypothetical protein
MPNNKVATVCDFFDIDNKTIAHREGSAFGGILLVSPVGCHKGKPKGVS